MFKLRNGTTPLFYIYYVIYITCYLYRIVCDNNR